MRCLFHLTATIVVAVITTVCLQFSLGQSGHAPQTPYYDHNAVDNGDTSDGENTTTTTPTTVLSTTSEQHQPETATTSAYHSKYENRVCNRTACVEPQCQCLSDKPPGGLWPEHIPQLVMITFEGAVTVTNFPFYKDLFRYRNPGSSGCPISGTYFVSHVDTNYKLVHELHRQGNEIAVHSISKSKNGDQQYWRDLPYDEWRAEFGGQKRIIARLADIPEGEIKGARAPNLQTSGNVTIAALVAEGFEYDCSSPSRAAITTPFFPYTLDYGGQRANDCPVQPCLTDDQRFPGFWEVLMNDWNTVNRINNVTFNRECATPAACILYHPDGSYNSEPDEETIFGLFMSNFLRYYGGNRAPFPMFLSEDWMSHEGKRRGLFRFLDTVLTHHQDVFFVSIAEVLQWMKHSSSSSSSGAGEYYQPGRHCKPVTTTSTRCQMTDLEHDYDLQFTRHCDYEHIDQLGGQSKRMVICDDTPCPVHYPWTHQES